MDQGTAVNPSANIFDMLEGGATGQKGLDAATPLPMSQRVEVDLIDGLVAQDEALQEKRAKMPGEMPFALKPLEPIAPDALADNIAQAFKRTSGLAPDQVSEVQQLAKQTKLPEPFVQANLDKVRDLAKYPDPDVADLTRTNPGTALFLSDPANMALAKDDVAGLRRLEDSLANLWPGVHAAHVARDTSPWGAWDSFWQKNRPVDERTGLAWLASAPGQAWDAGREQDALAFAYSEMLFEGDRPELRRTIEEMKRGRVQEPRADSYMQKIITGGTAQVAQYRDMLPDIGWPALAGGALMYGITAAATRSPAAAAVAAERGIKVGAGAGAFYSMFKLEGGSALEEYMGFTDENTGKPIDFNLARGAAIVTGAVNAGIEAAELALLLKMTGVTKAVSGLTEATKRQFVKEAVVKGMGLPSTRALLMRIGAKGTGAWLLESGQEGVQELVTAYLGELAKSVHNAGEGQYIEPASPASIGSRVGDTIIDASASFLPLMGVSTGIGAHRSLRAANKAKLVETKLGEFKAALDEQRLTSRSPEAVEQAVRTMTGTPEGKDAPPLYINARAFEGYFQQSDSMDEAMRVLEVMGITPEEFHEAVTLDADLALPTDKVASTLAPSKHWDGLAPDLKLDAFDLSSRQALGIDHEAEQVRIQELAKAFDEAQIPQEEIERLAGEFMASGRYSKNQARRTAEIFGNLSRTLTQSGHETPRQWFERVRPRIMNDTAEDFMKRWGIAATAADRRARAAQEEPGGPLSALQDDTISRAMEAARLHGNVVPLHIFSPDDAQSFRDARLVTQGESLPDPDTGEVFDYEGIAAQHVEAEHARRAKASRVSTSAVSIAEIVRNIQARMEGYQTQLAAELAKQVLANQETITGLSASIERDKAQLEKLSNQLDDGQTHIEGPLFQGGPLGDGPAGAAFLQSFPGFYSPTARFVEALNVKKSQPAKFWIDQLWKGQEAKPGLRPEEFSDLGLRDWLEGVEGLVSKEQVLQFIADGGPKLEEVVRGGSQESVRHAENVLVEHLLRVESFSEMGAHDYALNAARGELSDSQNNLASPELRRLSEALRQAYTARGAEGGGAQTKYGQWQLPGGENYREVLVTIPSNPSMPFAEYLAAYRERFPNTRADEAMIRNYWQAGHGLPAPGVVSGKSDPAVYRSSHWDEPNVLAHFRLNDRTDADGNHVLFVEEIQSDWHQKGRKEGYGPTKISPDRYEVRHDPAGDAEFPWSVISKDTGREINRTRDEAAAHMVVDEAIQHREKREAGVPNAPFKKSWPLLAFKRILREAAENGYDAVAWTTGEQQAERYDLSKQVREVVAARGKAGASVTVVSLDGINIMDSVFFSSEVALSDSLGKELAHKIWEQQDEEQTYAGLDLKAGGEGMKGFYDKMLPKAVQDYAKKIDPGAKVGESKISATAPLKGAAEVRHSQRDGWGVRVNGGWWFFPDRESAQARADKLNNVGWDSFVSVHSLTITPRLRQSVVEGQALYQGRNAITRGAIHWEQGQAIVSLFEKANITTGTHELGHLYLTELERLVAVGQATAQQEADLNIIREWVGEKGDKIAEQGQEKFADGFLTYLREGKAPTDALAEVFAKFKRWIAAVYKAVRSAGVKINPEVRGVYDRMLATEEELNGARHKYGLEPIFEGETGLDSSMVTAQEREAYETLANRASLAADIEMQKYHEAERNKYRRQLIEMFNEDLKQNIAWRIKSSLLYGVDPLGVNGSATMPDKKSKNYSAGSKGLSYDDAIYHWGKEGIEGIQLGLVRKGGVSLDDLLIEWGLESPNVVYDALHFSKTEARDKFLAGPMARFDAEWNEFGTPWANELQEKRLDAEARMLQRLARNYVPATMQGIKRMVERKVENMTVAQLQSSFQNLKAVVAKVGQDIRQEKYLLAVAMRYETETAVREQRQASQERLRALREKWAERVAQANERRRIALAEIRERTKAREEMGKLKTLSKRIFNSKRMDWDYREQAMAIVQRFGLGTPTMAPAMPYEMPPLLQFVQEKGIDVSALSEIPAWLFSEPRTGFRSVQTMTVIQMRELRSTLQYLHHQGINERKMLGIAEDLEVATVAERSVLTMNTLNKGPKMLSEREREANKILVKSRGLMAELGMVRYWADAADGFTNHGPQSSPGNTTTYLVHPFDKAESNKQQDLRSLGDKLDKIFEPYRAQDTGSVFKIEGVPLTAEATQEWGGMWDRQKVLMVALNMGNEGNIRALMGGYGWDYNHLAKITARLTNEEWRMVQQVWDLIEELYPRIDNIHRISNGTPLAKVEALPLDSPVGHLRGGYFPLIFDHRLSDKAAFLGGLDKLMNEVETGSYADEIQHHAAVFRKSNPINTFTKVRKGSSLPPLLSLKVLSQHLNTSLHYIHYGLPLRNAYKMVVVPEFRAAWVKSFGEDSYMELGNWLRRQARPGLVMPGRFDKMFESLRTLGGIQALGLSAQSALTQLSSVSMSWQEIGFRQFMKGCAIMAEHGENAWAAAADLSAYMADRRHNLDSTMHDLVMRLELEKHQIKLLSRVGIHLTVKDYQDFMYSWLQTVDALVAYPTWYGAYDMALNKKGMSPTDAVSFADEKVKRAQASGGIVDAPTFLRTAGAARLFSMFMSFSVNLLNNQAYFIRGWREGMISTKDFTRHVLLSWVLPPLLSSCIIAWGRGEPWPDFRDLFFDLFGYMLSGLPILREVVRSIEFGGRAGGSAAMKPLEDMGKLVVRGTNLLDDKDRDGEFLRAAQSLVDLVGFFVGVPTRPIWRAVHGVHDMSEGETVNPMRLFFRAPKEKK